MFKYAKLKTAHTNCLELTGSLHVGPWAFVYPAYPIPMPLLKSTHHNIRITSHHVINTSSVIKSYCLQLQIILNRNDYTHITEHE